MSLRKSKITALVPKFVDWSIFPDEEMEKELGKNWQDKIRLVLHQIIYCRITANDETKEHPSFDIGWIPLHSLVLKYLSNDAAKALEICKKYKIAEVFESDSGRKSYSSGNRSTLYRYNPSLLFPAHALEDGTKTKFRKEHITNIPIIKKVESHLAPKRNVCDPLVFDTVKDATFSLKMDQEFGMKILDLMLELQAITYKEYTHLESQLILFDDMDFFKECPYQRIHQKLTTVKSELRGAAYFEHKVDANGIPLTHMNYDVKNMQPALMSLLFDQKFRMKFRNQLDNHIMSVYNSTKLTDDILMFIQDCLTGKLWTNMMAALDKQKGEIKDGTFGLFYASKVYRDSEEYDYIVTRYPNIIKFLRKTKKNDKSKELPRSLQRVEGELQYNLIAKKLIKDHNFRDLSLIHDSFFFCDEILDNGRRALDVVDQCVKEVFEEIGVPCPVLEAEYYDRNTYLQKLKEEIEEKKKMNLTNRGNSK